MGINSVVKCNNECIKKSGRQHSDAFLYFRDEEEEIIQLNSVQVNTILRYFIQCKLRSSYQNVMLILQLLIEKINKLECSYSYYKDLASKTSDSYCKISH